MDAGCSPRKSERTAITKWASATSILVSLILRARWRITPLMPPAEPNSPAVNDRGREEDSAGDQEAPKLLVETGVEMLALAGERDEAE
jgi:hypothetical protein